MIELKNVKNNIKTYKVWSYILLSILTGFKKWYIINAETNCEKVLFKIFLNALNRKEKL